MTTIQAAELRGTVMKLESDYHSEHSRQILPYGGIAFVLCQRVKPHGSTAAS